MIYLTNYKEYLTNVMSTDHIRIIRCNAYGASIGITYTAHVDINHKLFTKVGVGWIVVIDVAGGFLYLNLLISVDGV